MDDSPIIPPPSTLSVHHEHRPVLYLPDGRVLVRQAGFHMSQTSGTNPSLGDRVKKTIRPTLSPRKGGKKGC